jgi:hypothetical protein
VSALVLARPRRGDVLVQGNVEDLRPEDLERLADAGHRRHRGSPVLHRPRRRQGRLDEDLVERCGAPLEAAVGQPGDDRRRPGHLLVGGDPRAIPRVAGVARGPSADRDRTGELVGQLVQTLPRQPGQGRTPDPYV